MTKYVRTDGHRAQDELQRGRLIGLLMAGKLKLFKGTGFPSDAYQVRTF